MGPLGAAPWHPERFCFIATALSASTGVTAPDKVDRLEARTAFRAPEPDARPEAVAVGEPGALQAAVAVPDAQQAAVVVAAPGAPQAAGAVPDAQQEAVAPDAAVAAEPDVQREAAVASVSGAQREAAVAAVSGAQREAAAASGAQQAVGPMAVARPLVASVESAETAAVRFWIRATMVSAAALERRVVSAAKVQAAADR